MPGPIQLAKPSGTILWARYSFSPNRLKYCGPDANLDLFECAQRKTAGKKLREILSGFEAAYPYIQFIARENQIRDPFDWRVIEAYWLGNDFLNNISVSQFYRHLDDHFAKRAKKGIMDAVCDKLPSGAKPHHAFHVLEIYRKMGSMRGHKAGPVLKTINNCLITWGKIVNVGQADLQVEYRPVVPDKNKLVLGGFQVKKIEYKFDNKTLLDNPRIGEWVSIHWNWACDILTPRQLQNLRKWTIWHLNLANLTF